MTPDKRERAIKYLTEEIRSLRMAPEINGCGPENWAEQLEIMETCLKAVRSAHFAEAGKMQPITEEQLREMDEPVWVACKAIGGGDGYWGVCQDGRIITPAGSIYDVKEIPHWVFYRRPLEGEV